MGHWSLLNVMACRAARQLGKPYIVCPAGALEIFGRSGALKRFFNVVAGRRMVNEATRCFAITELEREQFVKYGVPRDRIVIVPNGIDPQTTLLADEHQVVEFRTRHGLGEAPFILFLGRLDLVKGPDLLLDAFLAIADRFEKYQLVFAGPDEGMKAGMEERLADSAYTGRVRFIGYLGGLEKSAAYAAACLLVVPSRREAMSLVALEAGFAGTPVLLTDQCGFDEIEAIGGGGVCAPTAVGIAKRMATLLAQSVNLHAMGTVLQRHINQYYTWPAINQRCVGIYKSLCAGGA